MIQAGPIRPGGYNCENYAGRCLLARLKSYITVDQVITLQNAKGAFSNSNTFAVLLCHNHGFEALQIKASFGATGVESATSAPAFSCIAARDVRRQR